MPMAKYAARNYAALMRQPNGYVYESVAQVSLVEAAKRFDPASGIPFLDIAELRIMDAILDHCRHEGHSRKDLDTMRKQWVEMMRPWKDSSVSKWDDMPTLVGFGGGDSRTNPDEPTSQREADHGRAFVHALKQLTPDEQEDYYRCFVERMDKEAEIAMELGIGGSRAPQVRDAAIKKLLKGLGWDSAPNGKGGR